MLLVFIVDVRFMFFEDISHVTSHNERNLNLSQVSLAEEEEIQSFEQDKKNSSALLVWSFFHNFFCAILQLVLIKLQLGNEPHEVYV